MHVECTEEGVDIARAPFDYWWILLVAFLRDDVIEEILAEEKDLLGHFALATIECLVDFFDGGLNAVRDNPFDVVEIHQILIFNLLLVLIVLIQQVQLALNFVDNCLVLPLDLLFYDAVDLGVCDFIFLFA